MHNYTNTYLFLNFALFYTRTTSIDDVFQQIKYLKIIHIIDLESNPKVWHNGEYPSLFLLTIFCMLLAP